MAKHTSLTVSLPESLGDFIQQRVSTGRYPSASDVVTDALGLLKNREQTREDILTEAYGDHGTPSGHGLFR